jgi:hypothetical protein
MHNNCRIAYIFYICKIQYLNIQINILNLQTHTKIKVCKIDTTIFIVSIIDRVTKNCRHFEMLNTYRNNLRINYL